MSARVTWIGLDELRAALRRLPEDLAVRAGMVVRATAADTAAAIKAVYPEGDTGNLTKGVRVKTEDGGRFGVRYVVRSTARHAWLFEFGSQTRQTKRGANRGFMPAADIFVPMVRRGRRAMQEELISILEESGLDVRR